MWIRWAWRLSFKTFCNSKRRVAVEKRWNKARQDCLIAFNFDDWCFCKETYKETFGTSLLILAISQLQSLGLLVLGAGYRIREPTEQEKAQARSKSWPQWPPEISVLIFGEVDTQRCLHLFSGVVKQQVRHGEASVDQLVSMKWGLCLLLSATNSNFCRRTGLGGLLDVACAAHMSPREVDINLKREKHLVKRERERQSAQQIT